jgi:Insertion element 4 transposase N-terminal/Transposase DDE domain
MLELEAHEPGRPAGVGIRDQVALGALTATYPPELVDQVLAATGRTEQRRRLLPARVMVYYVLALALFAGVGYEEVMRSLVHGLGWARPSPGRSRRTWPAWHVPGASAIGEARARLGPEPLQGLFQRAVVPLATPATPGAWYRTWRVCAIDGTCLEVADTPANDAAFGRPGSPRGERRAAFPQVRLVGLTECGTHAIVDAEVAGIAAGGELRLVAPLARSLGPGMLVLGDRGIRGADLWRRLTATGAQLLWRARADAVLPVDQVLADGSYLSRIHLRRDRHRHADPTVVRVVEYRLDDPGRPQAAGRVYRLVTSILDPAAAPATELAGLYAQRWEIETALGELKTSQRGRQAVLRSRTPDGVLQEVWAHLLVHYALRRLMQHAAADQGLDPDRLSFTHTIRIVRRQVLTQAAFSP